MGTNPYQSASWMTDNTIPNGGGSDSGFDNWMWNLTQTQNPDTNLESQQRMYQELGEGNQGKTLFGMYQQGLTNDQINEAYKKNQEAANQYTQAQDTASKLNSGQLAYDDPAVQDLLKSGWLSQGNGEGGPTYNANNLGGGSGMLMDQPLFNHSIQTGADTGAFIFDPNRGFQTSQSNQHRGGWDVAGEYIPAALMAVMSAALMNPGILGAGFIGGLGPVGSGLFKGAEALMSGDKLDPMGIAGSLAGSIPGVGSALGSIFQYAPIVQAIAQRNPGALMNPAIRAMLSQGH